MSPERDLSYELSLRAGYVAHRLLGPHNLKATGKSKNELRYGNHGSLRIMIAGRKRGRWDDFETYERGDLLDLIRREQGCSLPDACDYARDLLGLPREDNAKPFKTTRPKPRPRPEPENDADRAHRIWSALGIWNEAGPIIGTPG